MSFFQGYCRKLKLDASHSFFLSYIYKSIVLLVPVQYVEKKNLDQIDLVSVQIIDSQTNDLKNAQTQESNNVLYANKQMHSHKFQIDIVLKGEKYIYY